MDDPWGSAGEPWGAKSPTDDLMHPPASFLLPDDLPGDDASSRMPSMQRKASTASDPWGRSADTKEEEDDWSQRASEDIKMPDNRAVPVGLEVGAPSWMADDKPNAWDQPSAPSEGSDSDEQAGTEAAVPLSDAVGLQALATESLEHPVDLGSPPRQSMALDTSTFAAEDASPPTVALPRMNTTSPIPRGSSAMGGFDMATEDENPFGQTGHSSPFGSPARSRLSTPQLGGNLAIPQSLNSPQFSDGGFGGFADPAAGLEDAWGSPQVPQDTWGQMELSSPGPARLVVDDLRADDGGDDDDEADAWGSSARPRKPFDDDPSVSSAPAAAAAPGVVQDWDAARREAERREARAPTELVAKLEKAWPSLIMQAFGMVEEEGKSRSAKQEEDVPQLDAATSAKRDRLMSELTARPSTLDYLVPYTSTQTYARASTALAQLPVNANTSLLAQADRRTERSGGTTIDLLEKEWNTRSMLGEPENEVRQPTLPSPLDNRRPGWNLFGRKTSQQTVPLTTSGGGLLQIKAMDPVPAPVRRSGESQQTTQSESQVVTAAPAAPVHTIKPASTVNANSRPASPAGLASTAALDAGDEPGATAVGRFLGRFRKKAASPSVDLSNKDLQLSTDDFSFLDQVPAAPTPPQSTATGAADLLGGAAGSEHSMDSLEAMLNGSAPRPPMTLGVVPVGKRRSSRQVSKVDLMPQPKAKPTTMDLFGDLDFSNDSLGPSMTKAAAPVVKAATAGRDSMWDDFLDSSSPPPKAAPSRTQQSVQAPQMGTPAGQLNPNPALSDTNRSASPAPPAPTDDDDGFGDFGSFGGAGAVSSQPHAETMDDFGNFFATSTAGAAPTATARGQHHTAASLLPAGNARPTVHSEAALHGRWPAPKSPIPPLLAPPPAGAPKAGSFDFLSSDNGPSTGPGLLAPPPGSSLPPSRSPSVALSASPAPAGKTSQAQTANSKGGLSAQDLSFFDSL